jgi:hypothetical protein
MSAQLYNIGPDAIADPGVAGGPGFTLSRPEWIAIQAYSTDALALPTTADAFRKSLGAGAPKDLSDFDKLIEAYVAVNQHVTTWSTKTFPASVALASDVYQYGTVKAPVYYPRILDEAKILERNPDDEQAKTALKAMLDNLKRDADQKSAKAGEVSTAIATFATDSELDKVTLVGADGKGGLVSYYDKKYGSTSAEVKKLTDDIAEQKGILKSANDEYDHDVVVAATSPTYAWVWPLGTIAAAVVAGVYGKRATDALDRARAAQAKIDLLADKLAADANLLVAIHNAEVGAGSIVRGLTEALPVIQKIQGVWGGIAADLGAISALIDDDIRNVPPIIMGLGVDEAIKSWHQVALRADAYRVNAYVKEAPGQMSMAAWKLANQVSSVRTVSQHAMAA